MKRAKIMALFLAAAIYFMPTNAKASSTPDDPGGGSAPIDGGLSLLIAAGVGYVAKKGYAKRKAGVKEVEKEK